MSARVSVCVYCYNFDSRLIDLFELGSLKKKRRSERNKVDDETTRKTSINGGKLHFKNNPIKNCLSF